MVPQPGQWSEGFFKNLDIVFTSLFSFELLINILVSDLYEFWFNWWNIFDVVVVRHSSPNPKPLDPEPKT